ncbi:DMT family transporter [Bacillus solitudinis]|uniref:DMT family transporter n=1 Tax=Bacillus solitudinis TaxID=2014074 RepID=UPI001D0D6730|nr:DMT family transporter [Bacillus solitudinis]
MKEQSHVWVYVLAVSAMAIWGVNVVMLKVLVEALPPATMTSFRIMLAGITIVVIVLLNKSFTSLVKAEWIYLLLGALFGVVIHHYFLAQGLTLINASNTVLILALVPLTTSILAVLLLGDKLTKWRLFGVALAFLGVLLIQGGSGSFSIHKGEIYIFIAMFAQALSFIYIKKATKTLSSKQVTGMMLVIGSLSLLFISLILEPSGMSEMTSAPLSIYIIFFVSSILATAGGQFALNYAIERIGAGQAAIFNNFVPFFGLISAAIFLGERVYWFQLISFFFIVAGVLFGTGFVERTWIKPVSLQGKSM